MDESEQALSDAADGGGQREGRIAKHILNDSKSHRLWESRHADLVLPVAEQNKRAPQIFALRDIKVRLEHRRALITHIRKHNIVGEQRDRLLSVFHGPMDITNAILAEHREYTIAVSSRVSTDRLIDVMHDPVSVRLLTQYRALYAMYFELYCDVVTCEDSVMADATKVEMLDMKRRAVQLIKRIHSEKPDNGYSSFDRQALLARSGRYPVLDYMVV
jgi:hypothetical protein